MSDLPPLYVVIPCLNRHEMLKNLLNSINVHPDNVVIIDTGSQPELEGEFFGRAHFINKPIISERNIQRWWNEGLRYVRDLAKSRGQDKYHTAILNSDLEISEHDLNILQQAIEFTKCSIAHPDHSRQLRFGEISPKHEQVPVDFGYKMTGYCFVINSTLHIEFDEDLKWWYGEDDLEWRARIINGVARVGGLDVVNMDPQGSEKANPSIAMQTQLDGQLFFKKWGTLPCY